MITSGCLVAKKTPSRLLFSSPPVKFACLLLLTGISLTAAESDWFVPLGPAPKAAPKSISGGESLPPLPLPATPLRRSERKRQPSAPKLIGKVVWGESAAFTWEGGGSTQIADWNLCPADLQSLLNKSSKALGSNYGSEAVNLATFAGDPAEMPVLFISGTRTLRLDSAQWAGLRSYVQRGGFVVFDSVAGSPYFYESAKKAVVEAFGGEPLRLLPLDHPLYHIAADATSVKYPRNAPDGPAATQPAFEGLYLGSRLGVLVSRYGLGCGWDDREVPLLKQAVYYDVDSANRLGVNIVAYAVGWARVGAEEAKPELFGAQDAQAPTDEFVVAQLVHGGAWNAHPGAFAALLRQADRDLAVRSSLKRVAVDPGREDLTRQRFLYLTGIDDFSLGEAGARNLRRFLDGGGTLLINNALGLATFDAAVRRELKAVVPEAELRPIPVDHPLFTTPNAVGKVRYSPRVLAAQPGLDTPVLEGIAVGGDLRVIYSPIDLEAGWTGLDYPMAKAWMGDAPIKLGENLVLYVATH